MSESPNQSDEDAIDERGSDDIEIEAERLRREYAIEDESDKFFSSSSSEQDDSSEVDSYIENPPSEAEDEDFVLANEEVSVGNTASITTSEAIQELAKRTSSRLRGKTPINYNEDQLLTRAVLDAKEKYEQKLRNKIEKSIEKKNLLQIKEESPNKLFFHNIKTIIGEEDTDLGIIDNTQELDPNLTKEELLEIYKTNMNVMEEQRQLLLHYRDSMGKKSEDEELFPIDAGVEYEEEVNEEENIKFTVKQLEESRFLQNHFERREIHRKRGGMDYCENPMRGYDDPYINKTEEQKMRDLNKPAYVPPGVNRYDSKYLLKEPLDNLREKDIKVINRYKALDMNPDKTPLAVGKNKLDEVMKQRIKQQNDDQDLEIRNSMALQTALYDTRCCRCSSTIRRGHHLYAKLNLTTGGFDCECVKCHGGAVIKLIKSHRTESKTTRSIAASVIMTKEEKQINEIEKICERLSTEVDSLSNDKKIISELGKTIVKALENLNEKFERAVTPNTTFKALTLAKNIDFMISQMYTLTDDLGIDMIKDMIDINFPIDEQLSHYKLKLSKQTKLVSDTYANIKSAKPVKPNQKAIMLLAQEEHRLRVAQINQEWEAELGVSIENMNDKNKDKFLSYHRQELDSLQNYYKEKGLNRYTKEYLWYQKAIESLKNLTNNYSAMKETRNRYNCIVTYITILKKVFSIMTEKIKLASYMNDELKMSLHCTVTLPCSGDTIHDPIEKSNLCGILLNLKIKYLDATFHDFLSDVGHVHSHKCPDIDATVTFIESTMGATWEKNGYYKILSHSDTLMAVYTVFILDHEEQKKELLELVSEYLSNVQKAVSLGGNQSTYAQENGTLMAKVREFRNNKLLLKKMVKSTTKPPNPNSARSTFANMSLEDQADIIGYVAEQKSSQSSGSPYDLEIVHDNKTFYLIPNSPGLYCSTKLFRTVKGIVPLNQDVWTLKHDSKGLRQFRYEATPKDSTKTGLMATFTKCTCGLFYHAPSRCLNKDY